MLIDVTLFVDVNYLVIGECDHLIDVSMLGKLKHLELIDCVSIDAAKELEGVKLIIEVVSCYKILIILYFGF